MLAVERLARKLAEPVLRDDWQPPDRRWKHAIEEFDRLITTLDRND